MPESYADIFIQNHTRRHFKFQVVHLYTGQQADHSTWILVAPGEKTFMMKAWYNHGLFSFGINNWKVNGIEQGERGINDKYLKNFLDPNGRITIIDGALWKSQPALLCEYKAHTLTAQDAERETIIMVFPTLIDFISPSGTSTTRWYRPSNDTSFQSVIFNYFTSKLFKGSVQ